MKLVCAIFFNSKMESLHGETRRNYIKFRTISYGRINIFDSRYLHSSRKDIANPDNPNLSRCLDTETRIAC